MDDSENLSHQSDSRLSTASNSPQHLSLGGGLNLFFHFRPSISYPSPPYAMWRSRDSEVEANSLAKSIPICSVSSNSDERDHANLRVPRSENDEQLSPSQMKTRHMGSKIKVLKEKKSSEML